MVELLGTIARTLLLSLAVFPVALCGVYGCFPVHDVAAATTRAAGDPLIQEAARTVPLGETVLAFLGAGAAVVLAIDRYLELKRAKRPRR